MARHGRAGGTKAAGGSGTAGPALRHSLSHGGSGLGRGGDWLLDRFPRATQLAKRDDEDPFRSDQERRIEGLIAGAAGETAVRHFLTEALAAAKKVRNQLEGDTFTGKDAFAAAGELKRNLRQAYRAAPVGERPHAIAAAIHQHALGLDDQEKGRLDTLSRRAFGQARRRDRLARLGQLADRMVDAFADTPELQILLGLGTLIVRAASAGQRDLRERAERALQQTIYLVAERGLLVIPSGSRLPPPDGPGGSCALGTLGGGPLGGGPGPSPVGPPLRIPGAATLGTLVLPGGSVPRPPFPAPALTTRLDLGYPPSPAATRRLAPPTGAEVTTVPARSPDAHADPPAPVSALPAGLNRHVAAALEAAAAYLAGPPSAARARAAARQLAQAEAYGLRLRDRRPGRDPETTARDRARGELVLGTVDGLRELAVDRTRAFARIRAAQVAFNQRTNPDQHPGTQPPADQPPPVARSRPLPGERGRTGRERETRARGGGGRGDR